MEFVSLIKWTFAGWICLFKSIVQTDCLNEESLTERRINELQLCISYKLLVPQQGSTVHAEL